MSVISDYLTAEAIALFIVLCTSIIVQDKIRYIWTKIQ